MCVSVCLGVCRSGRVLVKMSECVCVCVPIVSVSARVRVCMCVYVYVRAHIDSTNQNVTKE